MRKSADVKLQVGRWTVSRLAVFGAAVGILAFGVLALLYMVYGNREVSLALERTEIEPGHAYRINDGILFYETSKYYVSINPSETTKVEESEILATADGYDMSSTTKIVYLGSEAQILGQEQFVMGGGETIRAVRAGRRYAALLYHNQYGDTRILIVDAMARPRTETVATIAIAGGETVAFGFLQAGERELLWVSTVDVNQFSEESLVRIYNCDNAGSLLFYSSSMYNQTIENVILTGRCLFLIGTQDIIRYDRTEEGFSSERARVNIYGSRVVDCVQAENGESAYFITMPITKDGERTHIYRLLTVSQADDIWATVLQKFLSAPIVAAFLRDNSVCVVTTQTFERFSYAGKQTLDLELDETPADAKKCGDAILLFTDTACYRATVQ